MGLWVVSMNSRLHASSCETSTKPIATENSAYRKQSTRMVTPAFDYTQMAGKPEV